MHWFICIYYFVRNVHCTEQLRQLETRAAQSFSGAQGKFFGGDPSSPPPPTSPSTTFSFLSFLHGILVWYFAQKPEIFCQKNDWPSPPQKKITALPPKITGALQIAPFAPPSWRPC